MNRRVVAALSAGAAMLVTAAPQISAHHGWGGQSDTQTELSGTLHSAVNLSGPHATMQIKDEGGQIWDVTMASPRWTQRMGLTEETIPVGAQVAIRGNRNSDMKRYEFKSVRVIYGGVNYDIYPNRL